MIAKTPSPPYYTVIFTSIRHDIDDSYGDMAKHMVELAKTQIGFLGVESARNDIDITVSYWQSLEDIARWKQHSKHLIAQKLGKEKWYQTYTTRICKVKRDYHF